MSRETDFDPPLGDPYAPLAPGTAQEPSLHARGQQSQLDLLTDRVERLTLASQALWELLKEKHGLTETELKERMEEIDARDGAIDGRIGQETVTCPSCGRLTITRGAQCQFCRGPVEGSHTFRA